jgi:hypothetical protein
VADADPYAAAEVLQVQPRQLARFALLRTPPEGLPLSIRRVLHRPVFGINWRLAHRIPAKSEGVYWLVPGDHVHAETFVLHDSTLAAPDAISLR